MENHQKCEMTIVRTCPNDLVCPCISDQGARSLPASKAIILFADGFPELRDSLFYPVNTQQSVTMSCIHRLNNYGLVSESTKGSSPQIMLATSIRPILTREQLLTGQGLEAPLCKHRKGFLDHLKPRAFIMSVSKKLY